MAGILAGSWRPSFRPPAFPAEDLDCVAALLHATGASGLGWRRLRDTPLKERAAATCLRDGFRYHALMARLAEQQIGETFAVLRAAGIEPILSKGWTVARLYPELGLRPYRDIDLFVRPDELARARESLGREPVSYPVELHAGIRDLPDRSTDELYARSCLARLADTEVRVLCPEDELRHLCLHLLKHGVSRPVWLCDIAVMLETYGGRLDWDAVLQGHRRQSEWVLCTVRLAQHVLEAPASLPAGCAERLPRWLIPAVLRQWGRQPPLPDAMEVVLRRPYTLPSAMAHRWPNPVRATVRLNGPFNELPRWPFQTAQYARLALRCIRHGLRPPHFQEAVVGRDIAERLASP